SVLPPSAPRGSVAQTVVLPFARGPWSHMTTIQPDSVARRKAGRKGPIGDTTAHPGLGDEVGDGDSPHDKGAEQVVAFQGPMPSGVAVSHEGHIFVNLPQMGRRCPVYGRRTARR